MMDENDDMADLAMLLPFYVNGTLAADECARLDTAMTTSPELRVELAMLNKQAQMIKEGGKMMVAGDDKSEERLDAVMGQIEDRPVAAATPQPQQAASFLAFLNPKRWHPAVALGLAVAVAGQAAMIGGLQSEKEQSSAQIAGLQKQVGALEFELASGPDGDRKGDLMIQLNEGAKWADVETLLAQNDLSIVAGPSDGALTLSSKAEGAALDALIEQLRASAIIASADKAA
jgi:hypothetical protein